VIVVRGWVFGSLLLFLILLESLFVFSAEATGNVTISVPPIPHYSGYEYEGRISWSDQSAVKAINALNVDFEPYVLNLGNVHAWVECCVQLSEALSLSDINLSSVMLSGTVLTDPFYAAEVLKYDNGSVRALIVGFSRTDVRAYVISAGTVAGNVVFVVSFRLYDGTLFEGIGNIWVRMPTDVNVDGVVDGRDVAVAARAFGSYAAGFLYPGSPAHPRWNVVADENEDDRVDAFDLALILMNFGRKYA
jgi:hypothetical protein